MLFTILLIVYIVSKDEERRRRIGKFFCYYFVTLALLSALPIGYCIGLLVRLMNNL